MEEAEEELFEISNMDEEVFAEAVPEHWLEDSDMEDAEVGSTASNTNNEVRQPRPKSLLI
jgi:hypothetical protein